MHFGGLLEALPEVVAVDVFVLLEDGVLAFVRRWSFVLSSMALGEICAQCGI